MVSAQVQEQPHRRLVTVFVGPKNVGRDLSMAKSYNRRHKVCERHAKAPVVLVSSIRQRFCQQCSKYVFCSIHL